MIKLFKNVDEKLADIGFKKMEENKHLCEYDRENNEFGYIQKVVISYKKSGRYILQSYDPKLEVLFAGYSKKYCNTNITCEHKDKCKRLKDMIEKEAKKRND